MSKFDNIDIPANIDNITKNVIKKGRDEKNKRKRKTLIIASILSMISITGAMGVGIANPSLASSTPKLRKVFEDLNKNFGLDKDYIKYAQGIGVSKTINGVTITIDEAVSDGHNIHLTYVITSKDKLPGRQNHESRPENTLSMDARVKVKGAQSNGAIGLSGYYKDDYTFVGIQSYEFKFPGNTIAPEELDVDISIVSFCAYASENLYKVSSIVRGPFNFNIKINKNADTEILKVNKSNGKFKVKSIEVSSYSVNINVKFPRKFARKNKNGFNNLILIDTSYPHEKNIIRREYDLEKLNQTTAVLKNNTIEDSILINYKQMRYDKKPEYIVVKFTDYSKPSDTGTTSIKVYLNKK